jgi:hypothetical protein
MIFIEIVTYRVINCKAEQNLKMRQGAVTTTGPQVMGQGAVTTTGSHEEKATTSSMGGRFIDTNNPHQDCPVLVESRN